MAECSFRPKPYSSTKSSQNNRKILFSESQIPRSPEKFYNDMIHFKQSKNDKIRKIQEEEFGTFGKVNRQSSV